MQKKDTFYNKYYITTFFLMWGNISKTTCKLYTNKKFIGPIYSGQNYIIKHRLYFLEKTRYAKNAISVVFFTSDSKY